MEQNKLNSTNNFDNTKESTNNIYEKQIRKIAEVLGLPSPIPSGDSLQMCCPKHYEKNPSFGINSVNGTFHCFACDFKGHISKLAELLRSNILAEETDSIGEFEVSAKIDTVSYSAKPESKEAAIIRNRLEKVSLNKYTIKELLDLVRSGHTISLSGAKTNNEWRGQQVVMVDIDNDFQFTFDEVIGHSIGIGLEPTFAYHTYNSTEDVCRCRLAYVFKEPITDKLMYLDIVNKLIKKFEDLSADSACADLCRMFYGTMNKEVYVSNLVYHNRFTAEQINEVGSIICNGRRTKRSRANSKTSNVADSITRDTETEETDISTYMEGKKFRHDLFAKNLMQQYHFITLNTLPHFYRDGLYINNNENREIEKLIKKYLPSLGSFLTKEVINDLALFSDSKQETDYHTLAFENGLVDIEDPELKPFSPDVVLTSKLHVNFVNLDINTCRNAVVDKFMSDITDRRQRNRNIAI